MINGPGARGSAKPVGARFLRKDPHEQEYKTGNSASAGMPTVFMKFSVPILLAICLQGCSAVVAVDLSVVDDRSMCYTSYTDVAMQDRVWSRETYQKEALRRGLTPEQCSGMLGFGVPAKTIRGMMIPVAAEHCYAAYTDLIDLPSEGLESFAKKARILEATNNGFTLQRCVAVLGHDLPARCDRTSAKCYSEAALASLGGAPSSESSPLPAPVPPAAAERSVSTGSGFFVNPTTVITNAHVAAECKSVEVLTRSGKFPAHLHRADVRNDLASLTVDGAGIDPGIVRLNGGNAVRVGERIVAIGYPLSGLLGDGLKATDGIVNGLSGLGSDVTRMQISAPVQPGNSGGPLFNDKGLLVGVVVSKVNAALVQEITGDIPQNVNFAIKSSVLQNFMEANNIEFSLGTSTVDIALPEIVEQARSQIVYIECISS